MSAEQVMEAMKEAMLAAFEVTGPLFTVSIAVGPLVAILQAVTQIHEQTLTFVPKLIAIALVLLILGSWMSKAMNEFVVELPAIMAALWREWRGMDSSVLGHFDIFFLALARMGELVFISPAFSRRGAPSMVRTGLVPALSLLIAPGVRSGAGQVMAFSTFDTVKSLIREVILGLVIGCVFHILPYMLYVVGDFLDTAFGLTVRKVMDPVDGVQTFTLGQFVNAFLYPYFSATGCRLIMARLFAYSYQVVPVGVGVILGGCILWYTITLLGSVPLMVIKLVLPFVAAEFILKMTMGVLMKLTPQIHVFIINIQCKIFLGIMLMMFFAYPMGAFMSRYTEAMMMEVQKLPMMFG